ncbi:tRNA lysidine(34) synthetase TilS [uncultured Winogradskyella sp.]|uniref:tRNA lysidine(34) synthetase TilS n=1 Tax=uncultured Winogradskyella sp. TaxID=395353 RepID=UPI0026180E03|nr:tRNA lysidine(34) synthetase TilS [uncultured Winogradskyella sp.]
MQKDFENYIENKLYFLKEARLLIANSGGIDSVVITHLCHKLKLNFALAHCNFNLRGKESNADKDFVIKLGEQLDVEVFVQNFNTQDYANKHRCSIQMAARELRYDWFNDLAQHLDFDYILTAHHADDNLETFLINFTRGTGLNGLTGIPEINENIVRPLLKFSRAQIETYAKASDINWREDSSNSSRKYLRNKLRHNVVPILKEINPQLLDSFQSTLDNLNDTAYIVDESLNAVSKRAIIDIDEKGITYKISEFKKVNNPKAYLFEMFKDYGFTEWNDVVDLLDAETGKYVKSNTHRLIKHREFLILTDCHSELVSESHITMLISKSVVRNGKFEMPFGFLRFDEADALKENSKNIIFVDAEKLKFPLELRLWKKGDVFQPLGMTGKKKISKYLKDEKLSPVEKEDTWVLKSDNDIIWVVGRRADERFKVSKESKQILKIELKY